VLARAHDCDAVLLSEHEESGWTPERYSEYVRVCRASSTAAVTLYPGIEFNQDGFHVLCYGLRTYPQRPSSGAALAVAVHAQGCHLCLAHPGKYRWQVPPSLLAVVDAVEVWNSKWIYDGAWGPHPASLRLADGKLRMAGQDVHKRWHCRKLFVQTATGDVLGDLAAGRYVFEAWQQSIDPRMLASRLGGQLQRQRTNVLRFALRAHKKTKRLRSAVFAQRSK
jgi:hypothetical protein